jgi:iron complex outermembrane receptor protein
MSGPMHGDSGSWRGVLLGSAALLAMGAATVPATVFGAPPTNQGVSLEEVVVTASRQGAESIQTIPMAISAIKPEDLERAGQGGLEDYTRSVPSVSLQSSGPGQNKIDMRGITAGTFDYTDAQDRPLVSVYIDDVPVSLAASNPDLKVFDLERIEVIRGPQGTLYGAGAMSGTIRLITQKPRLDSTFGDVQTSLSNTENGATNFDLRGMINIPLIDDRLAMRVTAYHGENSGFVNNLATGVNKYNNDLTTQVRAAVRAKITDRVTIDASTIYMDLRSYGTSTGFRDLGAYNTSILWPEGYTDHLHIHNLTVNADLGFADLVASSSNVVRSNFNRIGGNQYTLAYYLDGNILGANLTVKNDIDEWDNEIRLTSKQEGKLRWTAGAFFQNQHRTVRQFDPSDGFDARITDIYCFVYDYCSPPNPPYSSLQDGSFAANADFSGLQHLKEKQTALFGEASYAITDKLRLTAGLRYFKWSQDFDLYFAGFFGVQSSGVPLTAQNGASVSGANPRLVASYEFDEHHMMFAEAARGFRYGGVNQPLPLQLCAKDLSDLGLTNGPLTFGPDHLMSYSVGEKGRYLGNRLLLNATAFLIDWKDAQTKRLLPDCFYYFIQNKGDIQSKGVELETAFKVTERLTLGLSGSYTKAGANGDIANLGAVDGDPVPYFPRYIVNGNGRYVVPFGSNSLSFQADWTFRDHAYTEFHQSDSRREITASDNLSANITYTMKQWEIGLFGQNLTNGTRYSYAGLGGANPYPGVQPGDALTWARPRTVGVRAKMMF